VPPSDKLVVFTRQSPRMARKRMYFSVEKAMRALGLRQTPVEQVLREAVDWFVVHAYAPAPPAYRTRVP
jgi:nucleoside-diphosphate-sugar epimerase